MDNKFLSRKFLFALIITFLGFGLVLGKYVSAKDWMGFVEVVGGTYVLGNSIEAVTDKFKDQTQIPPNG